MINVEIINQLPDIGNIYMKIAVAVAHPIFGFRRGAILIQISDEIGSKIIELNGDKSPNAVFLVGGGAHTPKLKEFLAENSK